MEGSCFVFATVVPGWRYYDGRACGKPAVPDPMIRIQLEIA